VRCLCYALTAIAAGVGVEALDLDVTIQDMERGLAIARAADNERATFHAPYIHKVDAPFVESIEVVSEYRRVVLVGEDHIRKGDRLFAYSTTLTQKAVSPWKSRVSIVARMRFHPHNTYVSVPDVDLVLPGKEQARIGVLKEPIMGLAGEPGSGRVPVLGAVVEGVFDAAALGDGTYEFIVRLDRKDVGRTSFNLAALQ
jgi:hypothetical protein